MATVGGVLNGQNHIRIVTLSHTVITLRRSWLSVRAHQDPDVLRSQVVLLGVYRKHTAQTWNKRVADKRSEKQNTPCTQAFASPPIFESQMTNEDVRKCHSFLIVACTHHRCCETRCESNLEMPMVLKSRGDFTDLEKQLQ